MLNTTSKTNWAWKGRGRGGVGSISVCSSAALSSIGKVGAKAQGRKPEAAANWEAMEKHCLVPCSPRLAPPGYLFS